MLSVKLFRHSKGKRIGLRCLECKRTFTQRAPNLFYDLGTVERKNRGEQLPFSSFFIPAHVICPHCQAEDRYDLNGLLTFGLVLIMLLWSKVALKPDSWFQVAYLGSIDGRILHPFEMRAWYAQQVADHPEKVEWRLRYANTLRSQGRADESEEQYRTTLKLAPRQTEAVNQPGGFIGSAWGAGGGHKVPAPAGARQTEKMMRSVIRF